MAHDIQLEQIHEAIHHPVKGVSYVLTDRLWPRGIRKDDLGSIKWYKEAGPTPDLRKAFHDGSLSTEKFHQAYKKQLLESPEIIEPLLSTAKKGKLCLLTATHDAANSYLTVLRDVLHEAMTKS